MRRERAEFCNLRALLITYSGSAVTTSIFTSFDRQAKALWGHAPLRLDHNLHERDMFTDAGLAKIIDDLPDELISIVTMQVDQSNPRDWSYCRRNGLSGAALIEARTDAVQKAQRMREGGSRG